MTADEHAVAATTGPAAVDGPAALGAGPATTTDGPAMTTDGPRLIGRPTGADSEMQRAPCLIGVGLGPGDPELITVKGVRAIRAADVVFVPVRRLGEVSYALTIAGDLIDERRQRVVMLPFPDADGHAAWRSAAGDIVGALGSDRTGVFLVEGDPMLYSSFGHIAEALAVEGPNVRVEAVPGVSSPMASAAAAGQPLAGLPLSDYADRVAIVPAAYHLDTLEGTLRGFECVVLLKVAPVLREVLALLARLDDAVEATYVRRVGRPDQQIVRDLTALAANPPRDYFSLMIVRRRTG